MAVIKITKENFESEVLASDVPVLIDFWAPWCGPCRMMSPVIEEIAAESDGTYKVGSVNVDDEPELAVKYSVNAIPRFIVIKNGEILPPPAGVKGLGVQSKDAIKSMIGA